MAVKVPISRFQGGHKRNAFRLLRYRPDAVNTLITGGFRYTQKGMLFYPPVLVYLKTP